MSKILTSTNAFIPMPVALIGTRDRHKPNFMTLGWLTRVNNTPPMIAVSINKSHYTAGLIKENRAFSVNIPGREVLEKVDYCGLVSGEDKDKSALFKIFYGSQNTAPMIEECPLCLECKLIDTLALPTNYLFVGEIVAAYANKECVEGGLVDLEKVAPLTLTMPDCQYRSLGQPVGKAWSDGKKLMKG